MFEIGQVVEEFTGVKLLGDNGQLLDAITHKRLGKIAEINGDRIRVSFNTTSLPNLNFAAQELVWIADAGDQGFWRADIRRAL